MSTVGSANEQRVKFGTSALANLANRATGRLAKAINGTEAAAALVRACCALPSAVAAGGVWEPEAACSAVYGEHNIYSVVLPCGEALCVTVRDGLHRSMQATRDGP